MANARFRQVHFHKFAIGADMAVPNFQQLLLPLLRVAVARGGDTHLGETTELVASELGLTEAEVSQFAPNGQHSLLHSRLGWARTYLARAGLLERTQRDRFCASRRGRALLAEGVPEIDLQLLMRYPEFAAWRNSQKIAAAAEGRADADNAGSPEDQIGATFERLRQALAEQIVRRLQSFTPAFFERLIIDLLLKMGYGGGRADMARALGRTGDGGVDGAVKEDVLGLDILYVQAKRYAPERAVPVSEVRDFIGSLDSHRAGKGVFVTTSYFPASAREFIAKVSKRVVLIDGEELAALMIRHEVGVRTREVFEIKTMDEDYFVE